MDFFRRATPVNDATDASGRARFPGWFAIILLFVVTLGVYWPATRFDFINFDDDLYVTSNVHVQAGLSWKNIEWAFANPVASNWHPLTLLSHMLDCQLFGLSAGGHHLTNIVFHALNAALVYILFQQLTGARWRSLGLALLFAIHPLRVESVAWVSERKDVLSAFWGFCSLIFYARYAQRQTAATAGAVIGRYSFHFRDANYACALLFFALGLMSKAMLVTWPFVMLLLDYWPMRRLDFRSARLLIREKIPFFVVAAVGSLVTFMVQRSAGAMAAVGSLPLGERFENAAISYCRYLGNLFVPTKLAVFYPYPGHWPWEKVICAVLLIIAVTIFAFWNRRSRPFLIAGWLLFLGTLVPVIGLIQVGDQAMADRYSYIPSLGILIMVVWGVSETAQRWPQSQVALVAAGTVVIVMCVLLTRSQLAYWHNSETLFQHALAVTDNNYVAHNNLGAVLEGRGQVDEAIAHYQEAVRLRADDAPAHYNFGNALYKKGRFNTAISEYQIAVRLNPNDIATIKNLGNALYKSGKTDEAVAQFQKAVEINPDDPSIHYNLGKTLNQKGQFAEAIAQYQQAIRLKPDYAEAFNNLGTLLQTQGRLDEAISQFQEAIRLKPDYAPGQ